MTVMAGRILLKLADAHMTTNVYKKCTSNMYFADSPSGADCQCDSTRSDGFDVQASSIQCHAHRQQTVCHPLLL